VTKTSASRAGSGAARHYKADDFAVVRFPVLPGELLETLAAADEQALGDVVRRCVADAYVREALYLASPALFDRLVAWEKGEGDFNGLAQTIARYLLRMAYRATPFGTFSGVVPCPVRGARSAIVIPPREQMHRTVNLDAIVLTRLAQRVAEHPQVRPQLRYATNDTLLVRHDVVTFTAYQRNRRGKRIYRRIELERNVYLDAVVEIARDGLTVAQIVAALAPRFADSASAADLEAFAGELVGYQLLCADQLVDITHEDEYANLLAHIPPDCELAAPLKALGRTLGALQGSADLAIPDAYASIGEQLQALGVSTDRGRAVRVDLHAPADASLSLGEDVIRNAERAVGRLASVTQRKGKLAEFVRLFADRFGEAEVPLLVVADELEALGYSDHDASAPALTRMLGTRRSAASTDTSAPLLDRLLQQAAAASGAHYLDADAIVDESAPPATPPGDAESCLVAWLALWRRDGESAPVVELRSVGAQEPGRVMGRFGGGSPSITDYLRRSADAAPDLVAEIVHLPEDRLGNISSRPVTARYEVRIRGGADATVPRIGLDDLLVSVQRERVLIRSRTLGRHLTLRMSNAHAYDRSDSLPLYRFLNVIASGDYTAEQISLRRRLPQAPFVPGLRYRGIIVGRPSWRLDAVEIRALQRTPRAQQPTAFAALRARRGLPAWVTLSQGDNVIPYCLDTDWMVADLMRSLFKLDEALLGDVTPPQLQPWLASPRGHHFSEVLLALRAPALPWLRAMRALPTPYESAVVPVWDRWAFFALYVSPHLQDAALAALRGPLDALVASGRARGWFFVRYRDGDGAHLRIRVDVPGGAALETAMSTLRPVLQELSRSRVVNHVTVVPYVRETARYGGEQRCNLCEDIFVADSAAVLDALPLLDGNTVDFWRHAAAAMDSLLRALGLDTLAQRFAFAQRAAAELAEERRFGTSERKRIGELYAASRPLFVDGQPDPEIASVAVLARSDAAIRELWNKVENAASPLREDQRYAMRWAVIHMRMNRMIQRDHRLQEAILWELLKRSHAAAVHRTGAPQVTEAVA
jgi:lantibiotic biosynthesis protein